MSELEKQLHEAGEIVDRIRPLLAGHGPQVQGAALADLVAMYLAGHNPSVRETVMLAWLVTVRGLIPIAEKAIMPGGWPKDGPMQ